jgi:hypothetical protein
MARHFVPSPTGGVSAVRRMTNDLLFCYKCYLSGGDRVSPNDVGGARTEDACLTAPAQRRDA